MKKTVIIFITLILLTLAFCSCKDKTETNMPASQRIHKAASDSATGSGDASNSGALNGSDNIAEADSED